MPNPDAKRFAILIEPHLGALRPTVAPAARRRAQAMFEIGRESDDDRVRARAWELLGSSALPAFTPTLIEDLARHASDDVRAAAAAALQPYVEEMQVRAALEQARGDPLLSFAALLRSSLLGPPALNEASHGFSACG